MTQYHPRKNDQGQPVFLKAPSQPTDLTSWSNPLQRASVVPDSPMPDSVCCIPIAEWKDAPSDIAGWEALAAPGKFKEPALKVKSGKYPASGVVILEPDERIWVISPSNQYAGYVNTFPKGTIHPGEKISLQANALKEAYEEAGLKVELLDFLVDSDRTTTTTRYYLARRICGNPAAMGWESQCVHLVPRDQLSAFVTSSKDAGILKAIDKKLPGLIVEKRQVIKPSDSPVRLHELSEISAQFSIKGDFTDTEMARIRCGCRRHSDDDKWFIYCEGDRCYFHRASSGYLFFVVDFRRNGSNSERPWVIEKCIVSLGALQDIIPSEPMLLELIDYCLLGKW